MGATPGGVFSYTTSSTHRREWSLSHSGAPWAARHQQAWEAEGARPPLFALRCRRPLTDPSRTPVPRIATQIRIRHSPVLSCGPEDETTDSVAASATTQRCGAQILRRAVASVKKVLHEPRAERHARPVRVPARAHVFANVLPRAPGCTTSGEPRLTARPRQRVQSPTHPGFCGRHHGTERGSKHWLAHLPGRGRDSGNGKQPTLVFQ